MLAKAEASAVAGILSTRPLPEAPKRNLEEVSGDYDDEPGRDIARDKQVNSRPTRP
jgi:hypothetical protein